MTLKELQQVLGDQISSVLNLENRDSELYRETMEKSDVIVRLSKQMINNADVILRSDKLVAEGLLTSSCNILSIVDNDR